MTLLTLDTICNGTLEELLLLLSLRLPKSDCEVSSSVLSLFGTEELSSTPLCRLLAIC